MKLSRLSFLGTVAGSALLAPAQTTPGKTPLKVGDMAPDFTIRGTGRAEPYKLSDYRGKKTVVLAFFPAAFTGG